MVRGILNQQTVDRLLQVRPVVLAVVLHGHCIENWVKGGELVKFCKVSIRSAQRVPVKGSGGPDRPVPGGRGPRASLLTELGGGIEAEFPLRGGGGRNRGVSLADFAALTTRIRVHEL